MIESIIGLINLASREFLLGVFLAHLVLTIIGFFRGHLFIVELFISFIGVVLFTGMVCCALPDEWRLFLGRLIMTIFLASSSVNMAYKIYHNYK